VPLLIGKILDKYCIAGEVMRDGKLVKLYDYTLPMCIFATFGVVALILAIRLKAEDKRMHIGLEEANIRA
jgi:hypothetical protein